MWEDADNLHDDFIDAFEDAQEGADSEEEEDSLSVVPLHSFTLTPQNSLPRFSHHEIQMSKCSKRHRYGSYELHTLPCGNEKKRKPVFSREGGGCQATHTLGRRSTPYLTALTA